MKNKRRAIKVWRIFRFQERFELPDTVRFKVKSPLIYIRHYVGSGQDDESINFRRQIMACKTSPRRHVLLAVFYDLLEMAADRSKACRGYILDEHFQPAAINKIAGWVGLDIKTAGKIIEELRQIGLIERVTMPEIELSVNGDGGGKRKSRARTRKPGKARAPLKSKGKTENGNGNNKKKNKTGKIPDKDKRQANAEEQTAGPAPGQNQDKAAEDPNAHPTESDAGVDIEQLQIRTNPPRRSFGNQPIRLGEVLIKQYHPQARQFAEAVCDAIGVPYNRDSLEYRSELGCWMQAWAEARTVGMSEEELGRLWDGVMQQARRLRIKRRTQVVWKRSPEAALRWLFDRLLAAAKRQTKQAEPGRAMAVG